MNVFISIISIFTFLLWGYCLYLIVTTLKRFPIPRKINEDQSDNWPFVSILIPARNEEANIENCLRTLNALDYPAYEVIFINDRSTDKTPTILDRLKRENPKLQVLHISESDPSWSGKNYALHKGIELAKGDWYLFSDADTFHYPISVKLGIQEARANKTGFLTFLSRMECKSFFERLIQPIASGLMTLWYPLNRLNDPKDPLGFANGQYILMEKKTYQDIGGHEAVKEQLLEDVALSERAKKLGIPFRTELGIFALKTRMYTGLRSSWRGWRRIFIHLAKQEPLKITESTIGFFFLGVLPFFLLIISLLFKVDTFPQASITAAFLFSVFIRGLLNWLGKMPVWAALFYPLSTTIVFGMLLNAIWYSLIRKKTAWRGCHY